MELVLALHEETHLHVTCDNRSSHSANLQPLLFQNEEEKTRSILNDPAAYGKKLYAALFPPNSLAQQTLATMPERLLIVASDPLLDAIPWEYVYGPYGTNDPSSPDSSENFLVLECPFVRGIPTSQRILPPSVTQSLHIVAIPSNPLSDTIEPLAIDAEWMRLKETIQELPYALTLERTIPPTMERVRSLVANQKGRVVHFMGHGGQDQQQGAMLCFEQDNGALHLVTAKEFVQRVRGTLFLVTLNACVSATPGPTPFSNLAAALVRQKTPYALGMRLSILDEDARTFSRVFYQELARGTSVEEALFQARWTLAQSPRSWVVGVPVLYTSLTEPAPGFVCIDGTPVVKDNAFPVAVNVLPPVEGTFQGRIKDLLELGKDLTGDLRPRILTILGSGGQGKTALALKAVERFAFAWSGGVWAIALDTLPARSTVVIALAQFLKIETQGTLDLRDIERQVLARLNLRRCLLVLDNAETLIDAVEAQTVEALDLVVFLKKLLGTSACLLVTSRVPLGWDDEKTYELGGLSPEEGAALFRQGAPQRRGEIDLAVAAALSRQLEGHPLGLRLLAGAFNEISVSLPAFLLTIEERLREAENKYMGLEHRHRKLYACIETSVRSLDPALRSLLSGLWIFHAPFLADTAVAIFDPDTQETEQTASPVRDQLYRLKQRSLLSRKTMMARDGTLQLYALLPTTRPYVEHHLEQTYDRELLKKQLIATYLLLARQIYTELDRSAILVTFVQQAREDFEWVCETLDEEEIGEEEKSAYWLRWGWVVYRLGNSLRGLRLLEQAKETLEGTVSSLALVISNDIALVYSGTGRPEEALKHFEEALPLRREVGDRAWEATTLNNIALVYSDTGRPEEALRLFEEALPLMREVRDRAGEATTLNNTALVYSDTGRPEEALKLFEEALPILREVGNRAMEATTLNNMGSVYQVTGRSQEALSLFEEALPIHREVGNRAMEATTLNNMGLVYQATGRHQEALSLFEEALPIHREVGNCAMEATTLNNMGSVYQATGRSQEALSLFEEALPLMREVGDRAGEATTLNNMGLVYQATGRSQEALSLFEEALPIHREVGNRAMEATTLNNMGFVYQATGRSQEALSLYEEALPIHHEVGNRAMEATTLNNMGSVYQATGRPQEALSLFEEALPIHREVGNRAVEATTLNNMGFVYQATGCSQEALSLFEEALPLIREVGDRAGEITTLVNLAWLLSNHLNQSVDAILFLEQALQIFATTGLPQDAAGQTVEQVQQLLMSIQTGAPSTVASTLSSEIIQQVVSTTIAVMTVARSHRPEWYEQITSTLQNAQQQGDDWEPERDFFTAVLTILDGQSPTPPSEHPYAPAIEAIQNGIIASGFGQEEEPRPFDPELIPKSINAFKGSPQEKMAHVQYLAILSTQTTDEQLKTLINVIQLALFDSDRSQLGQDLEGVYRQAWETILAGIAPSGGEETI